MPSPDHHAARHGPAVPLTWLHVGDLHLTEGGLDNHRDLRRIVALANALPDGALDFVLLPGDNADDGIPEQFRLVRDAVAPLRPPLHVLPGDHDVKSGSLDGFHRVLGAPGLPRARRIRGHRCLFLDVVSAGSGGPDFRLGAAQLDWVERQVADAAAAGEDVAIFMHTYPADLREGAERLGGLLSRGHVRCVDMGHTHYNEVANDGGTLFMATRSTGQIEEGPAGFSVASLDGGVVSWRFRTLDAPWPMVLITAPADRRLATAPAGPGGCTVRATVLGHRPPVHVEVQAASSGWQPMAATDAPHRFLAKLPGLPGRIAVRAADADGRVDTDVIEPAAADWAPPDRAPDGSDAHRIGAWPARGLLDTQLGPNRNGRKW